MAIKAALPFLLALCTWLVTSQALNADTCVAPSDYTSCVNQVTDSAKSCFQKNCDQSSSVCQSVDNCFSSDTDCATACTCGAYQGWLNCAVANCWNKAYSCGYQELVVDAVRGCGFALEISHPPYYPPPNNAPGACSCPIGEVFESMRESLSLDNHCQSYTNKLLAQGQITGKASTYTDECACCAASHVVSPLPDMCPNTDPSSIPFWSKITQYEDNVKVLGRTACVNLFSQNLDCTASPLNFTYPPNGNFYNAANIPTFGSQSISDTSGILTAPGSATIVWTFASGLPPATAVAATPSAGSGGSSGSLNGGSSATSSSSSPGKTSGASRGLTLPGLMLAVALTLSGTMAWL